MSISQRSKQLGTLLTSSSVGQAEKLTHVSMGSRKGRYFIGSGDTHEKFLATYCDAIFAGQESVKSIGLAEQPSSDMAFSNIRVDIDIDKVWKQDKLPEGDLYNMDHVTSLIEIYFKTLDELIVGGVLEEDKYCFYMSKSGPKRKNPDTISQGFHLHFPKIFVRNGDNLAYIIPRISKEIDDIGLFEDIVTTGTSSSSCLDARACIFTPWLMYGSGKGDNRYYELSAIFDHRLEEVKLDDIIEEMGLTDIHNTKIDIEKDSAYYLPYILSISPINKKVYSMSEAAYKPIMYKGKKKNYNPKNPEYDFNTSERVIRETKLIKEILPSLSDDRVEHWDTWTQMGIYTYNICKGSDEGFDIWYAFSQKAKTARVATEEECRKLWDSFYDMGIDIRALENLLKQDNLERFREYQARNSHRCILWRTSIKHYDVAASLHELYPDDFVYTKERTWYVFNNHGWEIAPEGMALRKLLSTELYDNHGKLLKIIKKEKEKPDISDEQIVAYDHTIEVINQVMAGLKSTAYKANVVKECTEIYYDPYFLNKLDNDPDLIRFNNGVMDLETGVLRDGLPSDYVSKSTNTNWVEYDYRDPRISIVMNYISQVFPDPDIKEYFLNSTAEFWRGYNFRKVFGVWTGSGNNSKTIMMSLLEKMFGEYMVKLPTSLITGKRTQSSGASPELIRTKGTRLCVLQEPSKTDQLNSGIIKELTGNDSFYCRGLFSNGIQILPLFKLIIVCNDPPSNAENDLAYWERIKVLPYEATFTSGAPKKVQEQIKQKKFPKDPNFARNLEKMVEPFTFILIKRYGKIRNRDYDQPLKVTSATDAYKQNNDIYLQYIADNIVEDPDSILTLQNLYPHFKDWIKDFVPNSVVPKNSEVLKQFNSKWANRSANAKKTSWKGLRVRTSQDDMEENSQIKNEADAKEAKEANDAKEVDNSGVGVPSKDIKEGTVPPNTATSPHSVVKRSTIIEGRSVLSRWLVGGDCEYVGRVEGGEDSLELVTDRVGNRVVGGKVVSTESGQTIGEVKGGGIYSYVSYFNEKKDGSRKTVICTNNKPKENIDNYIMDCRDDDYIILKKTDKKTKKKTKEEETKEDAGVMGGLKSRIIDEYEDK